MSVAFGIPSQIPAQLFRVAAAASFKTGGSDQEGNSIFTQQEDTLETVKHNSKKKPVGGSMIRNKAEETRAVVIIPGQQAVDADDKSFIVPSKKADEVTEAEEGNMVQSPEILQGHNASEQNGGGVLERDEAGEVVTNKRHAGPDEEVGRSGRGLMKSNFMTFTGLVGELFISFKGNNGQFTGSTSRVGPK